METKSEPRSAREPAPSTGRDAARYRANLQGEVDSASLYRALAAAEPDPQLAKVYGRLAAVEEAHAAFWTKRLAAIGARLPRLRAGFRTRALAWLARRFGPAFVLPTIDTLEHLDSGQYDAQPEAVAGGLPAAERSHARILEAIAGDTPGSIGGGTLARLEGRHRGFGGNALRAAVLGANDGLVSNLSLVMGVAGAALDGHAILITGLAGLLAGACSMALGEWLSVTSSRESYQRQIDQESDELTQVPEEEKEELILIYQAKGLGEAEARALADRLMANRATALDTLVREELGIDPKELGGSAWAAGGTSFILFSVGAAFPVVPFAFLAGPAAVIASVASSGVALFAIGAGTSLFTGRSTFFSGLRQLAIGLLAAAVTFGIGKLIGVAISG
ncbi:MAG TPA: VIT1/CCC1 transporter family protein [Alphaproteobacteria bacterium]|nr:VIT1/CCC1 transporter family protein [Alphaproteobacteria bacterium]